MISLDEYKTHLINSYSWELDNCETMRLERKSELEKRYSNQFLEKIIKDTYSFIYDIYNYQTIQYGYCNVKIEDDTTSFINLGLHGGWFSDRLYTDMNNRIISEYIIKYVFGEHFLISIKTIETESVEEFDNDIDLVIINNEYYLSMQGFPSNMNEIKESLFGKSIELNKS